jgi:hypothetical protein
MEADTSVERVLTTQKTSSVAELTGLPRMDALRQAIHGVIGPLTDVQANI